MCRRPLLQSGWNFKNAGRLGRRVKILRNDLLNKKFRRHEQGLNFLSEAKLTPRQPEPDACAGKSSIHPPYRWQHNTMY